MENLKSKVQAIERTEIVEALDKTGWIKAKAARFLGITERMIGYKVKKYGIKREVGGEGDIALNPACLACGKVLFGEKEK